MGTMKPKRFSTGGHQQCGVFKHGVGGRVPTVRPEVVNGGRGGGSVHNGLGVAQISKEFDVGRRTEHDELIQRPTHLFEGLGT